MGNRSKLCLSDSLGRGEPLGQRLESLNGQGLSSDSLDGISRQLLGSLGNLPENDPVLRDMLASMASAPPTLGDTPDGEHPNLKSQPLHPCDQASQSCSSANCITSCNAAEEATGSCSLAGHCCPCGTQKVRVMLSYEHLAVSMMDHDKAIVQALTRGRAVQVGG